MVNNWNKMPLMGSLLGKKLLSVELASNRRNRVRMVATNIRAIIGLPPFLTKNHTV